MLIEAQFINSQLLYNIKVKDNFAKKLNKQLGIHHIPFIVENQTKQNDVVFSINTVVLYKDKTGIKKLVSVHELGDFESCANSMMMFLSQNHPKMLNRVAGILPQILDDLYNEMAQVD